ncbi:MAG: PhnD/SsuA/transferrin family substrate-binding protein [Candidatus Rokubacteria bacterium]|nr:PhnD/SsuA/transferrin family substrate-binding protein [Candidatus Rokubacteria bacterium]
MIASARMYEWTPSLSATWRRLLAWVAARARVDLEIVESRAVSLDQLWAREDMGCVFMCGYPYALRERRPELLCAPVPAPPRYGGKPVYVTDFIVREESGFRALEDTFGGRIAYSAEHSHSGYNAARYHLLRHRTAERPALFAEVKGPYVRQRAVIQAVLDGEADVAAIDGYGHDLLRRHDPAVAARLRAVATTAPAPSPPLVASPAMPPAERERLREALLAAHEAPELKPVLEDLLLLRLARVEDQAFQLFLDWEHAAAAAGYAKLR